VCVGVLSIIELKNAWWNNEIRKTYFRNVCYHTIWNIL